MSHNAMLKYCLKKYFGVNNLGDEKFTNKQF